MPRPNRSRDRRNAKIAPPPPAGPISPEESRQLLTSPDREAVRLLREIRCRRRPPASSPAVDPQVLATREWLKRITSLDHQLMVDSFRKEIERLLWAFPEKKVNAEHRYRLDGLISEVVLEGAADQVLRKVPPRTAFRQMLAYVRDLRPLSFRLFLKTVRESWGRPNLRMYRPLYREVLLPVVRAARRHFTEYSLELTEEGRDSAGYLTNNIRERLAQFDIHTVPGSLAHLAIPNVTPDLMDRRSFEIAKIVAARSLGLSRARGKDLSVVELDRLLKKSARITWRIPEWETPQARRTAEAISPTK